MKLNYNEWLKLAFWEYNRYPDAGAVSGNLRFRAGCTLLREMGPLLRKEPVGHDSLFQRRGGQRTEVL